MLSALQYVSHDSEIFILVRDLYVLHMISMFCT